MDNLITVILLCIVAFVVGYILGARHQPTMRPSRPSTDIASEARRGVDTATEQLERAVETNRQLHEVINKMADSVARARNSLGDGGSSL